MRAGSPDVTGEIPEIDLAEFGEEFFQDPPAGYRAPREHGPALPVVLPNGWRGWLVTSYDDARRLLADHRLRKNVNEMARLFPPGSAAAYGSLKARPGDDLLSRLIHISDEGSQLTAAEVLNMTVLLLVAGFETTVNLIGNGVLALLRNPGQLALLRSQPALMPGAIEEVLRYDGPLHTATVRFTSEPVRVGDVEIPEGRLVFISLLAADRDATASPIPGGSTSSVSPAATSRSGTAFTTAWARRWPGWKDRSRSGSSCAGSRI